MSKLRIIFACFICAAGAFSAAQNIAGKWKGQVVAEKVKLPPDLPEDQRRAVESVLVILKKVRVNLDLKPNKTYTATFTGLPKGQQQKNEGTWQLKGGKLWLTSLKANGKPSNLKDPQALTVGKDAKTLTLTMPDKGTGRSKIVFKR